MPRTVVDALHWALWAAEQADGGALHLGYRSQTEFYTPPRRGNTGTDEKIPVLQPPSEDDYIIARQIQKGVDALRSIDNQRAAQLVEFFGAYPGAPSRRKDRIYKMRINHREAHRVSAEARQWVEGWVYCHRQHHRQLL